jgi:hypothetical protein
MDSTALWAATPIEPWEKERYLMSNGNKSLRSLLLPQQTRSWLRSSQLNHTRRNTLQILGATAGFWICRSYWLGPFRRSEGPPCSRPEP